MCGVVWIFFLSEDFQNFHLATLVQFVRELRQQTLQNAGRAPNGAYPSAVYAAQEEESKDSLTQEMRGRKGNVTAHSVWVLGVGKVKDADLGLC